MEIVSKDQSNIAWENISLQFVSNAFVPILQNNTESEYEAVDLALEVLSLGISVCWFSLLFCLLYVILGRSLCILAGRHWCGTGVRD